MPDPPTAGRLLVGLACLALLAGCAAGATAVPAPATPAPMSTAPVSAPTAVTNLPSPVAATVAPSASPFKYKKPLPVVTLPPVASLAPVVLASPMPVTATHVPFTPKVACSGGSYETGEMCQLSFSVYAPASGGPWPLVVLVPGSSDSEKVSDIFDYADVGQAIAGQGAVVMVPQYRQDAGMGGGYPVTFQDIACAVGVARRTAATYGADPSRVTMVGHSYSGWAGAVVALTPKPFTPATGSCDPTAGSLRPDAFLGVDGAYAMVQNYGEEDILTPAVYAKEATRAAGLAASDPSALAAKYPAGAGSIPIELLHGARDSVVPLETSLGLDAALAANGYGSTLRLVPGADHYGAMLADQTVATILALAKGQ